jgi:hypothetical protein
MTGRAIIDDVVPKCVASTDAPSEAAFKKRKPPILRNLFAKKDTVMSA